MYMFIVTLQPKRKPDQSDTSEVLPDPSSAATGIYPMYGTPRRTVKDHSYCHTTRKATAATKDAKETPPARRKLDTDFAWQKQTTDSDGSTSSFSSATFDAAEDNTDSDFQASFDSDAVSDSESSSHSLPEDEHVSCSKYLVFRVMFE